MELTVLQKIERFLRTAEMPPASFGRRAVNDPRLVFDLRNGREPRSRTLQRIERFIAAQEQDADK